MSVNVNHAAWKNNVSLSPSKERVQNEGELSNHQEDVLFFLFTLSLCFLEILALGVLKTSSGSKLKPITGLFLLFSPHLTLWTPIWEKKNSQSGDDWLNLSPYGLTIPLLQSGFGGSGDGGSFVFAFWVAVHTNQMGWTHGGRAEMRTSHFHFFCRQIKLPAGLLCGFTGKLQFGWLSWRL